MSVPIYVVDAFAESPFKGNPAAVCLLEEGRDAVWMQSIAAEMNLSETAFPVRDGDAWRLRWFTPKAEVDLCGHATLASAHVLWEAGTIAKEQPAIFQTRSGTLTCRKCGQWIEMDFPAEPPMDSGDPGDLLSALGGSAVVIGQKRNRMDYLVEMKDEKAVRNLSPDLR